LTQGALAETAGWNLVMHLTAALCVVSLLLTLVFYRPPPRMDEGMEAARAAGPGAPAQGGSPFRLGLRRRELVLVLLAGTMWSLYNVGFIVVISFAPDFLRGLGLSPAAAGARASVFVWMTLITVPLGGFLAERSGRPDTMLALSMVLFAAAAAAIPAWDGPVALFVALGVVGGVPAGIIMALPARAVRAAVLAPAMGLYYTYYYIGMAVLPAAAGWSLDVTGAPGAPLLFTAVMMLLALAALGAFRRVEARETG
jgi:predicted MFS family arabinose efflux permease